MAKIGTWIDSKTGQGYSGVQKNPSDKEVGKKTGILETVKKVAKVVITPTIPGLTTTGFKIAKNIQEGISKSGASVALSLTKKPELKSEELPSDLRTAKEIIFGKDPLESLETRISKTKESLKKEGLPITGTKVSEKLASPLAVVGVLGQVAMDFTGLGGEKAVIKALAKTSKVDDVVKILSDIKIPKSLISSYAEKLAKTTDTKVIKNTLTEIKELDKRSSEFLKTVQKYAPELKLDIAGEKIIRDTDELAIKAKTFINDLAKNNNIQTAEKIAKSGVNDSSIAIGSELIKRYKDEAIKTTNQVVKDSLYEKASDIAHTMATNLTEAGRGIQASTIMGRLTPEGILRFAAKEINNFNQAVIKTGKGKQIPNLTTEQTKYVLDEALNIENMADGVEKAMAWRKLFNYISDLTPTPLFRKLVGFWKAGLLTGIKTTGLNTMANLFHGVSEGIKDVPAVAVDKFASLFTGERTMALTGKRTVPGTLEGLKKGWRYLKTGFDERDVATKLDYRRINFGTSKVAKALQTYEEGIFRFIGAQDQPFYYSAKAHSLQSQAIAKAKNAGLKGNEAKKFIEDLVSNPTDEMLKYATGDAEVAVFQNKTKLGELAKGFQALGKGAGEVVVPFGRTPASVATQLINYSPVGIVKTIIENAGKGKFDQRLFSQGIGRGITGSGVMAIGAELFKNGLINTAYPKDEKTQKLWEVEGRIPNSIKIGNKWRNINVLGPLGPALVVGAKYQESLQKDGSPIKAVGDAIFGGVRALTEQTFLQNLNLITEAINNPQVSAGAYFSNMLSSTIPTFIGDVAKFTDDVQRKNFKWYDPLIAKIPGVRKSLQPRINILGEEMPMAGGKIETAIDPSRPSTINSGIVVDELRRLADAKQQVVFTQLGDKKGYKGLSPEGNTLLWKRAGEIINGKLEELLTNENYKKTSNDKKKKLIEAVIKIGGEYARAEMIQRITKGLTGETLKNKLRKLKENGLLTESVFKTFLELQ